MIKFNVTVVEDNGDINRYPEATSIVVTNDKIEVAKDDEEFTHQMQCTDEIIIKPLI